MNPGKTGYFYILDRTNGKPLIGIEERPVPQEPRLKTARTQPYPIGDPYVPLCPEHLAGYERGCLFSAFWDKPTLIARNGNTWAPMTFSPKTGLAYLPANIWDFAYRVSVNDVAKRAWSVGNYPTGGQRSGMITAMDPTTNKVVWQKKMKFPVGGGSGLLSTAGGLLFHGGSDGNLIAFDISNGNELWKFQTGAGANAPVSTFEVGGEQYVAIMAGGNFVMLSQQSDLLWAFKVGGTVPEAHPPKEPPLVHPAGAQ
jgi:glucose dehydrogenase